MLRPSTFRRALGPIGIVVLVAVPALACSSSSPETDPASTGAASDTSVEPVGAVTATALCRESVGEQGGPVPASLTETSGLVASRAHPGVLWAHDDSGGAPEVVAIDLDGADHGSVAVTGAEAFDWEDIALLPGADGGPDRLVVGDIGDNFGRIRQGAPIRLYVVDEPTPPGAGAAAASAPAPPVPHPNPPR